MPRTDVNPRPLSSLVPSNGLIGVFSGDEKLLFAIAWERYQELLFVIIGVQTGKLERLAACFGIDLLGFAILSNHFHTILGARADVATWDDTEVARR